MAEAILNRDGQGRFHAFSAGSFPKGAVHPLALSLLEERGHPLAGLRSKSWDEYAGPQAPKLDFIFTVCDSAAGEVCPIWPGHPMTVHWGLPDPAAVLGCEAERRKSFQDTYRQLQQRIGKLINLPFDGVGPADLKAKFIAIGGG